MKKILLTLTVLLAFYGTNFAQPESHWSDFNYHDFEQSGALVAAVSIDGNMIMPTYDNYDPAFGHYINYDYEVAAFVNDVCRGHSFLFYYDGDDYPTTNMMLIYYDPNTTDTGVEVSFKLYDHVNQVEYVYCTSSEPILTGEDHTDYWDDLVFLSFSSSFNKTIEPYTNEGGYYLIASPVDGGVMAKDVLNLRSNNFDFYSFDQMPEDGLGLEWVNHREEEDYVLQSGMGYLYANSNPVVLTFIGAPYAGDGTVTLEKKEGPTAEFSGWNLVGNPFAQKAYPNREFYVMNDDGSEIVTADRDTVSAMEGIFVIAASDGEQMQFSTSPINSKGQIVLNVTQNRGNVVDRAIVRFGQGGTLPKFMLNQNHTKMYIQMDDNDYAVVRSNKAGELPVNFEPAQNGTFTISVNTENLNVKYLHLIDRATGMDTDLLQTPSYKFDARTNDDPRRFVLVFKTGINIFNVFTTNSGNKDDFSFFSNGNWIINNDGEAILQVVDVNGRILSSEEINGCVSKRIEAAPGVYMLRLVNGNDVKVQKIVVE